MAAGQAMQPKLRRRWFQYRLRSLLIVMTLLTLPLSWFGWRLNYARIQRAAFSALRLNVNLRYDYETNRLEQIHSEKIYGSSLYGGAGYRSIQKPGPQWVRDLLGIDFVANIESADIFGPGPFSQHDISHTTVDPALLRRLACFRNLRSLTLSNCLPNDDGWNEIVQLKTLEEFVFDWHRLPDFPGLVLNPSLSGLPSSTKALQSLGQLPRLTKLVIFRQLTDEDLRHLAGLRNLKYLSLAGAELNDAGLKHIAAVRSLETLDLSRTHVTDEGLVHLAQLPNLEELVMRFNPQITDRGLAHLRQCRKLRVLYLDGTHINDTGLENISTLTELRYLQLSQQAVTDAGLAQLQTLVRLERLELFSSGPRVFTEAGVGRMLRAMPALECVRIPLRDNEDLARLKAIRPHCEFLVPGEISGRSN
ncbi:MAG: hypothetical protein K8T91_17975 [Planctomycetes bacterium]|nr:hypothetical protein [Planctomycetota bacterium]